MSDFLCEVISTQFLSLNFLPAQKEHELIKTDPTVSHLIRNQQWPATFLEKNKKTHNTIYVYNEA